MRYDESVMVSLGRVDYHYRFNVVGTIMENDRLKVVEIPNLTLVALYVVKVRNMESGLRDASAVLNNPSISISPAREANGW